jgi:hypothetical protein
MKPAETGDRQMNINTTIARLEAEFEFCCAKLKAAQRAFDRSRSRKNAIALESAMLDHEAASAALIAARDLAQKDADRKARAAKRAAVVQRRADLAAAQLSLF